MVMSLKKWGGGGGLCKFAKDIDQGEPLQSAQVDLSRNVLLLVNFLQIIILFYKTVQSTFTLNIPRACDSLCCIQRYRSALNAFFV